MSNRWTMIVTLGLIASLITCLPALAQETTSDQAKEILKQVGVNTARVNPSLLDGFPRVRISVVTPSSTDLIWRLSKEPDLADILVLGTGDWGSNRGNRGGHIEGAVDETNLTSEQIAIIEKWVMGGKAVWANYGWWNTDAQGIWTLVGLKQKWSVDLAKGEREGNVFFMTPDQQNGVLRNIRKVGLFAAGRDDHYGRFLTFSDPKHNMPTIEWSLSAAATIQAAGVRLGRGRIAVVPIQMRDGYDSDALRANILLWLSGRLNP
jgi:hypothetical protein